MVTLLQDIRYGFRMLLRNPGFTAVVVGIAVGLLGTFWLSSFIESLLFEISPHDPATLVGAVVLFIAVAALAAWIPARRAAKTDPMVALRRE